MIKKIVKFATLILFSIPLLAFARFPACTNQTYDSDGDGWGWQDGESCRVRYPLCDSQFDLDGDGWGWTKIRDEGSLESYWGSCLVYYPDCKLDTSDPDGDGWGWEDEASCIVPPTLVVEPHVEKEKISLPGLPYVNLSVGDCTFRRVCPRRVKIAPNAIKILGATDALYPYPLCKNQKEHGGLAWEEGRFCIARTPMLSCSANAVPTEYVGWGWENGRLCDEWGTRIKVCDHSDKDLDRDGWIWFNIAFGVSSRCLARPEAHDTKNMSIRNGHILDTNGKVFIPRGIKLHMGDDVIQNTQAIQAISETGANMIDLHVSLDTASASLESAIDTAIANNMITSISIDKQQTCVDGEELGEGAEEQIAQQTGGKTQTNQSWTQTWLNWRAVLLKEEYQPYLLLGLANGNSCEEIFSYQLSHPNKISTLREAGFTMPFIISPWPQPVEEYELDNFKKLIEADPSHNLILSWDSLSTDFAIERLVGESQSVGVGVANIVRLSQGFLIPGPPAREYIFRFRASFKGLHKLKAGWIAENWARRNGRTIRVRDSGFRDLIFPFSFISMRYESLQLTGYGEEILYGEYGIEKNAVKATSFSN